LFARDESTRLWCALPMFWTAGMNTAMGATLAAGGCWVMQEGFDAGDALRLIERERVTEPYTIPHQARALEEHPD
jgi:fatty-acyl-CoA synthase